MFEDRIIYAKILSMDKEILRHKKYVEERIVELRERKNKTAARDLQEYHVITTRNFQHERAIHLAVTLFFAVLMIGMWVFTGWLVLFVGTGELSCTILPVILLVLILTVLEGFYIRYYYALENRTQRLYELDKQIYDLLES